MSKGETCYNDEHCKSNICKAVCVEIVSIDSNCNVKFTDDNTYNYKYTSSADDKEYCSLTSGYKDLVSDVVKGLAKLN